MSELPQVDPTESDPEHAEYVLPDPAAPELSAEALLALQGYGVERAVDAGDVLFRAGDASYDFYVVLEGAVDIVRSDDTGDHVIVTHGPGRFLGELNLLTGQRPYLTATMARPGRVLRIPLDDFRRLMSSNPELADVIFRALMARRELLRAGPGNRAVRIIGSRFSPEAMALRSFAARSNLVYEWIDLEDADDVDVLLASMGLRSRDTPVVVTSTLTLRHPSPGEFADHLGLTFRSPPGYVFDLVVVGSGPAGLAASVYGASEGLDTVSIDAVGTGGQAGASSRIENYAGFPNGISGEDLASRTAIQAQRLGARLNSPCAAIGLRTESGFHAVLLADDSEIPARAVIIASGARYQRLAVDDLERFEGAGVYYAATDLEARLCAGSSVVVVGGGNSAGQAAIYLAQHGCAVSIAVRRSDLAASMSRYLVERIDADPRIMLRTTTEVRALAGDRFLESVTLVETTTGTTSDVPCAGLFCFIGAEPATGWLDGAVELDERGFVLTDRALMETALTDPEFQSREPLPFETSVPGVFAVGDVRRGSLKRVAAAVGEGSSAVRSVHDYLSGAH
ncbi:MAG: FAD-dependent oxidoreductase [Acidimicrobiia bacterium]